MKADHEMQKPKKTKKQKENDQKNRIVGNIPYLTGVLAGLLQRADSRREIIDTTIFDCQKEETVILSMDLLNRKFCRCERASLQ